MSPLSWPHILSDRRPELPEVVEELFEVLLPVHQAERVMRPLDEVRRRGEPAAVGDDVGAGDVRPAPSTCTSAARPGVRGRLGTAQLTAKLVYGVNDDLRRIATTASGSETFSYKPRFSTGPCACRCTTEGP